MAQRYELPNGKFIEVDEDFVGSQDEKDLLDTFNAREQQQGTETSQSTQSDTVVPDGKENNWIYDNVVVAPYEGTRKFINSSGRLIEDLGDTLGEATNFYGLALGDKAENGLVELVSKKTAKERGLKDPIFGESDKRDFYNGGIKGFFYDPAHPENDDHTTSLTGSFVESGVQFLLGYATAGRILNKFGAVTPTTKLEKFVDATTKGAIGDFLAFDENSGRFADVVTHYAPDFGNTYLSYLQTNKDDTWYEGRLKNSLEGMGLGLIAEVIFKVAKSSKNFASKTLDEADFKADQQVIAKSQEAILSVKDKLDEAKTIGEKMKIVNDALEDVDGLKPAPKIISKEEKVVLLNKIAQEDLLVNYERWKAGEMSAEEAFSIPRAWINLDTIDKSLTTSDFIKTTVSIVDAVKNSYPQVEKKFSDEVIKRKAILEYGGDLNKVFQDFSDLTKVFKEKDIAPLIYQHEVTLNSLVNMLAPMVRQSKMGLRPQAEVDTLIDLIGAMQNNRKIIASEFGGGLNTFGKTKEEFLKANILEENFRRAIGEFQNFSAKDPEAKAKLLDKLSALDRPDVSRRILNFVFSNRIWDITNEVWVNALLSNPKTFAINAVSNAITAIARPIEDALGAKLSIYLDGENLTKKAIYEGQIREAKSTLAGLGTYLQEATKYMGSALKNGELILESSSKADTTRNFTGTGLTGKIIRTPTRILNATDEFFKQINYRAKLSSLAVQAGEAKGYKGKDLEEFIAEYIRQGFDEKGLRGTNLEALRYAQENTFTNELTGFSKKFQDAIQTYPVLKQFFPFVRTPFQLAKAIADRTVGGVTYNLDHLLGKSGDPKMIAKVRGQTAMGGILLTSATLLSEFGMLSSSTNQNAGYLAGKGDGKALDKFDDAELVRLKKSETNFKPYSFNIGNVQIPFGRLDPYGAFFGIVADYSTNKQRFTQAEIERIGADMQLFLAGQMESSPISMADMTGIRIASAYGALKDNILNKTYFQAIHDIVEAVNDKDSNKLQKYFTNKVGSILVPNIVSKIVNDPYLRDAQGIIDEVIGKRLGLGTPPSPKYNFMGEAHTAGDENSITRFYNNFLNPVPVGTKTDDPVANEILRLGKAPEVLKKFQDGVDYTQYQFGKLSAYDRVNQLLNSTKIEGMTLKDKLADEIQSEGYKNRTDPIKLAQGIADDGTKYQRINQIYNVYKIKAETLFEAEKANYKNIDNPDRNLFTDIKKQQINQNVIRGSRDTNRLQPLINFYQQ
jgi:hypothetical protein